MSDFLSGRLFLILASFVISLRYWWAATGRLGNT